jgi:uncharacterized membrane protein YeaQ/YmgE (transglycosylase-associated protein family)
MIAIWIIVPLLAGLFARIAMAADNKRLGEYGPTQGWIDFIFGAVGGVVTVAFLQSLGG